MRATTSQTDMFFIEAQPFEREYSQSQQAGGGGGGGDQDDDQSNFQAPEGNHRRHLESDQR